MSKKVLVTYFSATGRTKQAGETIAKTLGADVFEIQAKIPYSRADLDWNDENSRCVKEWEDPSSRPEIAGPLPDVGAYDIIFVGYPIWWEASPNIIYTFLESFDFSGRTVIPFSTSGSSVKGSSGEHLHKYCQADWKEGKLLKGSTDVSAWCRKCVAETKKSG